MAFFGNKIFILSAPLRQPKVIMILILGIAFGLRLLVAYGFRQSVFNTGDLSHDFLAQNLLSGDRLILPSGEAYTFNAPGYATFLAFCYALLGRNWWAVALGQSTLAILTTLLVYWIGRDIFDRRVGLLAAALVALNPYTLYQSSRIIDTSLFTVFLLLVTGLALRTQNQARRRLGLALGLGLILGLGCLVRSTLLVIFMAIALWLLLELGWRTASRAIVLCLLGMALVITPWTIRNWVVSDASAPNRLVLVESKGMHNLYMGNNPLTQEYLQRAISLDEIWHDPRLPPAPVGLSSAALEAWYRSQIFEFIVQRPLAYIQLLGTKFLSFWSIFLNPSPEKNINPTVRLIRNLAYTLSYTPLLILGGVGIWLNFTRPETRLVVLILGFYTLVHVLIWGTTRMRIPLDTLLALYASEVLWRLYPRVTAWNRAEEGKGE
jgi:4-amino-4-deoxy-L-arabinose transferase-like glycosyltransferase